MITNDMLAFDFRPSVRHKDENGFLRVDTSHITKETVNPYYGREIPGWQSRGLDPEKIYYGYRAGEELAKGAKTFDGLPLLLGHHTESAEDPQKEHRVGSSGTDSMYESPYLNNSLFVTDDIAIRAIEDGSAKEISCAYMYDPDFTPGEFEGKAYDFVMRNIRGNHIALVKEGRAGQDVVVADAALHAQNDINPNFTQTEGNMEEKKPVEIEAIEREDVITDGDDISSVEKIKQLFDAVLDMLNDEKKAELAHLFAAEAMPDAKDAEPDDDFTTGEAVKYGEKVERDKLIGEHDRETDAAERRTKIDERMRAAADRCGMDAESEEFQKAFAEGVKYGEEKEKSEPKKLDSLHEREGMEKAMDAAINASKAEMTRHFRELNTAGLAVRSVLGNIDVMAFDSADDIYGKALEKRGININGTPKSAWRYMFEAIRGTTSKQPIAADSKPESTDYSGPFANLKNIRMSR